MAGENYNLFIYNSPAAGSLSGTEPVPVLKFGASQTIVSVSLFGNVATLACSAPHGFAEGQSVVVAGLTNTQFNGAFQITSVTLENFSFVLSGSNLATTTDSGTARLLITEQTTPDAIAASAVAGVTSFNTRTGAVVSQAGDYTAFQVAADQVLLPSAVKVSLFTASPGVFYPVNVSGGSFTGTLPTAPADQTRIGFKIIAAPGVHTFTYACGGSDVLNVTGGSTSGTLTLMSQGVILQYDLAAGIWYVMCDDLPLGQLTTYFNGVYVPLTDLPLPANLGGTGRANNVANTITFSGSYSLAIALTGATSVTFPTSGTLATTSEIPASANPSATIGLSAVDGTAATFMTSDSAPTLSQAIVPTWTGLHTYSFPAIATTETDAQLLTNTTAATTGTPVQQSPATHFQGQAMFQGAATGSGATVNITAVAGAVTAATLPGGGGGTGYPISTTVYLLVVQTGGKNCVIKGATNGSGVITSYTSAPVAPGTGYTTATGLATVISLSMTTDVLMFALPVVGTAGLPTVQYQIMMQVDGGGYGAAFTLSSAGNLVIANNATVNNTVTSSEYVLSGSGSIFNSAGTELLTLYLNSGCYACLFNSGGEWLTLPSNMYFGWQTSAFGTPDTYLSRAAAGVVNVNAWFQNTGGDKRLASPVTVTSGGMTNFASTSWSAIAGRKYSGFYLVPANNSVAAEGLQFDMNGGSATWTAVEFGFAAQPVGATVGTADSTAPSTPITLTTATTGNVGYLIYFSGVCNAGGTVIMRGAPNTYISGTATFAAVGFTDINDMAN